MSPGFPYAALALAGIAALVLTGCGHGTMTTWNAWSGEPRPAELIDDNSQGYPYDPMYDPNAKHKHWGGQIPGTQAQPQYPNQGRGPIVRCESVNGGYRECPVPFNRPPGLLRQLSDAGCIEGRTWGITPGRVWVSNGCRGEFGLY